MRRGSYNFLAKSGGSALLILCALALFGRDTWMAEARAKPLGGANSRLYGQGGAIPLAFEPAEEHGQGAAFMSRGPGYQVLVEKSRIQIGLQSTASHFRRHGSHALNGNNKGPGNQAPEIFSLEFAGGNPNAALEPGETLPGVANYLIGDRPEAWRLGVRTFRDVQIKNIYPQIDASIYGNQRQLEYDLNIHPGGNPAAIRLRFAGLQDASLSSEGDLILKMEHGQLRWKKPFAYQDSETGRVEIPCQFVLTKDQEVTFAVGPYDASRLLTIDPALVYSTYLGGSDLDVPGETGGGDPSKGGLALDTSGSVYIAGRTLSVNFPATNGFSRTSAGANDIFVTKLDSNGTSVVFSTYIGGSGNDEAYGIDIDTNNTIYLTGSTDSSNFPKVNAFQTTGETNGDAFIIRLAANGSNLLYATYFGGSGSDVGNGIVADNFGMVWITGTTLSGTTFPKKNAFQSAPGLNADAFVSKLNTGNNAQQQLVWSSLLGGSDDDLANAIAVDPAGNVYITGETYGSDFTASDFPILGGFQTNYGGGFSDGFVAKIGAAGSKIFCSFLGGMDVDMCLDIALDTNNNIYVVGDTYSIDYYHTNGAQTVINGNPALGYSDGFITKISSNGLNVTYSSFLGGDGDDFAAALTIGPNGLVYVAGSSTSLANFPVTPDAYRTNISGPSDAVLAVFNTTLSGPSSILYATYFGGADHEYATGVAVDSQGFMYIGGETFSSNSLPITAGAFQTHFGGGLSDGFVTRFAPPADLAISQITSSPSPVTAGSNLVYKIVVTNFSRSTFTGVTLTNKVPAGASFVSATASQGSCSQTAGVVTCALGTVTNNAGVTVTLTVVPSQIGTVTESAGIIATQFEREYTNNISSNVTVVKGSTDVGVSIVALPATVFVTSNVTFTVTVTNRGPGAVSAITLTNVVPAGLALVSVTPSQGSCNSAGGVINCNLGSLAVNGSASISVTANATTSGGFSDTATVSLFETDTNPANDSAAASVTVNPLADLGISQTAAPNPVAAGSNTTASIVITNRGPSSATGVVFTNLVSAGTAVMAIQPSQGSCTLAGNTVNCTLGTIASSSSASVMIILRPSTEGTITNTSIAASAVADPNLANNTSIQTISSSPTADLSVGMTVGSNPTYVSSNLVYNVRVANLGPSPAAGVVLSDFLPAGVSFNSAQASQGSCGVSAGVVTCNLGTLASGDQALIVLILQSSIEQSVTNRASVTASTVDPVPGNNTNFLTTSIQRLPTLQLQKIGTNVIITWLTNSTGFSLQLRTNLAPAGAWITLPDVPQVISTNYTVTNSATAPAKFYRLIK
jgi:uncharacterized repeat protein (TIGR01451 family)